MTFPELTEWYAAELVGLRREEEGDRRRLDERLAEVTSTKPRGMQVRRDLEQALARAAATREELVHAARQARGGAARADGDKRSVSMGAHQKTFRASVDRADVAYGRAIAKARKQYDAELKRIEDEGRGWQEGRPLPDEKDYALSNQHKHREKALRQYQAALGEARVDYDQAWEDARTTFQGASRGSLTAELHASEQALSVEAAKVDAAERDYERSVKNAKATYFNAVETIAPDELRDYFRRRAELAAATERAREELRQRFLAEKKKLGLA